MLFEVFTSENWMAGSFKILRELKPGDFSLKLPIHTHEHWLEALEVWWRPEA